MPEKAIFAAASVGTILMGIAYKLRKGEALAPKEWVVLILALAGWGLVAFAVILFNFPSYGHGIASALLSPPLGVGLSETFMFFVVAIEAIFKALPEMFKSFVEKWSSK